MKKLLILALLLSSCDKPSPTKENILNVSSGEPGADYNVVFVERHRCFIINGRQSMILHDPLCNRCKVGE